MSQVMRILERCVEDSNRISTSSPLAFCSALNPAEVATDRTLTLPLTQAPLTEPPIEEKLTADPDGGEVVGGDVGAGAGDDVGGAEVAGPLGPGVEGTNVDALGDPPLAVAESPPITLPPLPEPADPLPAPTDPAPVVGETPPLPEVPADVEIESNAVELTLLVASVPDNSLPRPSASPTSTAGDDRVGSVIHTASAASLADGKATERTITAATITATAVAATPTIPPNRRTLRDSGRLGPRPMISRSGTARRGGPSIGAVSMMTTRSPSRLVGVSGPVDWSGAASESGPDSTRGRRKTVMSSAASCAGSQSHIHHCGPYSPFRPVDDGRTTFDGCASA